MITDENLKMKTILNVLQRDSELTLLQISNRSLVGLVETRFTLAKLIDSGFVERYTLNGKSYYSLRNKKTL